TRIALVLIVICATFVYNRHGTGKYNSYNFNYHNVDENNGKSGVKMDQHSFHAPFIFEGSSGIPNWEYGGSAVATESFVRLVPAIRSRVGYLWNTEPVQTSNWEVEMEFNIHNTYSPGADGMAFWYAKETQKTGGLFGNIDEFDGLGVVFDTYDNNANGDNPAVVAIIGHGQSGQWDYDNDLKSNQLDRCRSDFRNALSGLVKTRIQYLNKVLTVWMDTTNSNEYTKCFSVHNVQVPKGYYFGVTAMTGGLADYHDVYGFVAKDLSTSASPSRDNSISNYEEEEDRDVTYEEQHNSRKHHGWYDPYQQAQNTQVKDATTAAPVNAKKSSVTADGSKFSAPQLEPYAGNNVRIPEQPPTFGLSDEEEHKFFEDLRSNLKKFGYDEKKGKSPENELATQNGLLIMEALEEVARTVKASSTKNDIQNIVDRVQSVANKQQHVQTSMSDMSQHISQEVHQVLAELKTQTGNLQREMRKFDGMLNGLNVQVDDLAARHQLMGDSMNNQIPEVREQIRKSSSWFFWLMFLSFQCIFVLGILYIRSTSNKTVNKVF
ncbi:hypothetical protein AKO1_007992, partial [Acrasis kona]